MATQPSAPAGFPRELLQQPGIARYRYFESKVVAHARLKEVHAALWHAIQYPSGASLIAVFGPTGVGKTTLRLRVEKDIQEAARAEQNLHPGHIPVVAMEAVTGGHTFDWKDYYIRALKALDEPLLAFKADFAVRGAFREVGNVVTVKAGIVTADLRRVLEQCLLERQPKAFILDEAQHLKKVSSGRRLLDQMDHIKSLASTTQTLHVLVGTYELLDLANLSAQLSRRSLEIHFPRYRAEYPEDRAEFTKLVRTLQKHLPLEHEPDLERQWELLYEQSLGCAGLLKTWLSRALACALEQQATTLTREHLEQSAESPRRLVEILHEIQEGELALADSKSPRARLQSLLGLAGRKKPEPVAEAEQPAETPAKKKSKGKVGERRPQRDVTGGESHGD